MYRGDTPTYEFELPFDTGTLTKLNVSFAQNEKVLFERSLDEVELEGNIVRLTLTESETLRLSDDEIMEVQLRMGMGETRKASQTFRIRVQGILKDGVL